MAMSFLNAQRLSTIKKEEKHDKNEAGKDNLYSIALENSNHCFLVVYMCVCDT